ncbi:MAG TPA: lipid IV(A) palmitoyltransferase PagP [Pseudogulbenkiania sp.]|nr:lipid IV(A) palmitoyltransferase PagP [Pseudogulbenkiania sp.]
MTAINRPVLFSLLLASAVPAWGCSDGDGWLDGACRRVDQVWQEGQGEVYLPGYSYHLRSAYRSEKIASFNEESWGFGLGRGLIDADGDWHGLYAMAFLDSHNDPEPIAGYAYQSMHHFSENWQAGLGFTAFLTSRADTLHYFPVPGVLPLASVQYKRLALMGTYIPGGKGNGNVVFLFARYGF